MFPVFLIWISVLGCYYLVAHYMTNTLINPPSESFYSFSTTVGILLGVFQYYMKRNEEKVFSRISLNAKKISDIISQETNFDNFFLSLEESNTEEKSFRNWISNQIDPKLKILDVIRTISKDEEISKEFRKLIRRTNKPPINLQVTDLNSDRKYAIIENSILNSSYKDQLKKAYSNFFGNEKLIEDIFDKIQKDINLTEFGILTLNNINIINEVLPQLINNNLIKEIDILLSEEAEFPKFDALNSSLYRERIQIKIMKKIFNEKIF